jgi:hypothetical protein
MTLLPSVRILLYSLVIFSVGKPYAQIQNDWIEDSKTGCKVFNPNPVPNEKIEYVGNCSNGFAEGRGVVTWYKNGVFNERAEADFKNGKLYGQVTYTYASGNKFVGQYKDYKRNGQGTFIWANGDKYVGEYKDNQKYGRGTFSWASGAKYVGEFKDDKRNGQGTYTFAEGSRYVGEYKDNQRNGLGTFIYSNGNKYVGEHKDGKFNGQGTYTWADGRRQEGIWSDDSFVRSEIVQQVTMPNPQSLTSNTLDIERKKLEEEKLQLAEERRKLEEEKQKIKKPSNPGNSQKSQPSIKELRCTQLGLIQGSEDYKKCIN